MTSLNTRARILQTAESLVNGDRNIQYGDPNVDFQRTADMWSAYLGIDTIKSHDVAAMMCLLKVSRIRWSPTKEDSWVDLAGYAAAGADCALPPVPDEAQSTPNYYTAEPGTISIIEECCERGPSTREVYPDGDPL